jgi:hypothetical protein
MCLFSAYWFFDMLDTADAVGAIPVLFNNYLVDTYIHMACRSESLTHLYTKPDKPEPKRIN